jgi:hypothetical protein
MMLNRIESMCNHLRILFFKKENERKETKSSSLTRQPSEKKTSNMRRSTWRMQPEKKKRNT